MATIILRSRHPQRGRSQPRPGIHPEQSVEMGAGRGKPRQSCGVVGAIPFSRPPHHSQTALAHTKLSPQNTCSNTKCLNTAQIALRGLAGHRSRNGPFANGPYGLKFSEFLTPVSALNGGGDGRDNSPCCPLQHRHGPNRHRGLSGITLKFPPPIWHPLGGPARIAAGFAPTQKMRRNRP